MLCDHQSKRRSASFATRGQVAAPVPLTIAEHGAESNRSSSASTELECRIVTVPATPPDHRGIIGEFTPTSALALSRSSRRPGEGFAESLNNADGQSHDEANQNEMTNDRP